MQVLKEQKETQQPWHNVHQRMGNCKMNSARGKPTKEKWTYSSFRKSEIFLKQSVGTFLLKHTQSSRSTFKILLSSDKNGKLETKPSGGQKHEDNVSSGTEIWDVTEVKKLSVLMWHFMGCGSFVVVGLGCHFYLSDSWSNEMIPKIFLHLWVLSLQEDLLLFPLIQILDAGKNTWLRF